ncbi:MAG: endonuclease MutS2 [Thermomicrobiales bacterium]
MSFDNVLEKLEFGEIRRRLSVHCQFNLAARRAMEIGPSGDRRIVRYLLDVTTEAVDLINGFPELTVGGARDIREQLEKAAKGGRLMPDEFLRVMDSIKAGRDLRQFFIRLPESHERFPNITEFAESIDNFSPLEVDLARSIGPRGDVLDGASPELGRIRRAVRVAHSRLMDRLNSFLAGGRYSSALQENIITIRDGRYVLPVRSDARGVVRGIVHDTSSSGQTLFMEPFDVVELNNRWREEQLAEQREVERILDFLSQKVGADEPGLNRMIEAIAAIDLAMAKARLARAMDAVRPDLHEPPAGAGREDVPGHPTHFLSLINARHPLLDQAHVVPTSIEIGEQFRVLLITGPNTGGKTVALKTVGLLTLMAQTGLFLPVDDGSIVSVFPSIFVDIGDEQSIEQSLSTFSSHIRNIIRMLRGVGSDSLVLLDEVGAGTDPVEGSALARALMTALLRKKAMVIATTHYSEVKAYAYATRGVENASVEFDVQTLSPTYRLTIGIPGRSNALAIATRMGMPKGIVAEAEGYLDPGEGRTEELIDDIRERREEITRELERTRMAEEEARMLRRRAAQSLREAEEIRRNARDEAIAEVERELATVRTSLREAERARTIAPRASAPASSVPVANLREVEQHLRTVEKRSARPVTPQPRLQAPRMLRKGDRARILSLDQEGEVLFVDAGGAQIQMGSLKTRQPLSNLERVGRSREDKEEERARIVIPERESVPIEIDLRGLRAEEIPPLVERYVQDAYLMGMPFVRIIHGKGTGALRQAVREELRRSPVVARNEAAGSTEGGEGATLAHLRQS